MDSSARRTGRFARASEGAPARARFAASTLQALIALLGAVGFAAAGSSDLVEHARATFTGAADGPGDGKSQPAEIGAITSSTSTGKSLRDQAPQSGISRERLVLSDCGTVGGFDSGYRIALTSAASATPLIVSLVVEPQSEVGSFQFILSESAVNDFCLPGSVTDGSTVELMAIDDGVFSIHGRALKTLLKKGSRYRIDLQLNDLTSAPDTMSLVITNLATGDAESFSDTLPNGFRAVRSLYLKKRAGRLGDLAFDDLQILAPVK